MDFYTEHKDELLDFFNTVMTKVQDSPTLKLSKECIITRDFGYICWLNGLPEHISGFKDVYTKKAPKVKNTDLKQNRSWIHFLEDYSAECFSLFKDSLENSYGLYSSDIYPVSSLYYS